MHLIYVLLAVPAVLALFCVLFQCNDHGVDSLKSHPQAIVLMILSMYELCGKI